ncbi:MAG TPA: M10 family metallopeptidase C-terminal domain-containing protein [Caulobacteraceae bacterium]
MVHELGHALGLAHPGAYDSADGTPPTYDADAEYIEDTRQYSLMSYWSATSSSNNADHKGFEPAAPMMDDIAAMQLLYGAPDQAFHGNTIYGFNSNANRPWLLAQDLGGGSSSVVIFCAFDTGGIDTFDFSGYGANQKIDLVSGRDHFSDVASLIKNVSIFEGTVIENAKGGGGDDTILGNSANNTLEGYQGLDTINGADGADSILGGIGNDSLNGDGGNDTVRGNAGADRIYGGGIDNDLIHGDEDNDTIDAGAGNDSIFGDGNDDSILAGAGQDTIDGGQGNDIVHGGLDNDTIYGGDIDNDSLYGEGGADSIDAGAGNDWVDGGDNNDFLQGGVGNDMVLGGLGPTASDTGGNDTLDGQGGDDSLGGGKGDDTYYYRVGTKVFEVTQEGVDKVLMFASNAANTFNGVYVENMDVMVTTGITVYGTSDGAGANSITSGAGNDALYGLGGNDTLIGSGGNDTLDGGSGTDSLNGGLNNDWYAIDSLSDTVNDAGGDDTLEITGNLEVDLKSTTDNIFGTIEALALNNSAGATNIYGDEFVNRLIGNDSGNILAGYAAADRLNGRGGNDWLIGDDVDQAYDDTLDGGDGDDTLYGGGGTDKIIGGAGNDTATYDPGRTVAWNGSLNRWEVTFGSTEVLTDVERMRSGGTNYLLVDSLANGGFEWLSDALNYAQDNDTILLSNGYSNASLNVARQNLTVSGSGGSNILLTLATGITALTLGGDTSISVTGNGSANTIIGNAGANTIDGGAGSDSLAGGAGNDFYKINGSDTVNDTSGSDTIQVVGTVTGNIVDLNGTRVIGTIETLTALSAAGAIKLYANDAANNISANEFDNRIEGRGGNDTIGAGSGKDTVYAGSGNDSVDANLGDDSVFGEAGNDTLLGGALDNDYLDGGIDNDSVDGGTGNDTLRGSSGNDKLIGGDGDDVLSVLNWGDSTVSGGAGIDILTLDYSSVDDPWGVTVYVNGSGPGDHYGSISTYYESVQYSGIERYNLTGTQNDANNMSGAESSDTLVGGGADDSLNSLSGSDEVIDGKGGADRWLATLGGVTTAIKFSAAASQTVAQVLTNGTSVSKIEKLSIVTGSGNDNISTAGYWYNDVINTGAGNDTIATGMADDTVNGGDGIDVLVIDYTDVNDPWGLFLNGATAAYSYYEGIVFSGIERFDVIGTQSDDNDLTGGALTDTLIGGNANDSLNTLTGVNERVDGRDGADRWLANLGSVTTNIVFSAAASQLAEVLLTNGTKVSKIEKLTLTTGSGADNLSTAGYGYNDVISTGAGDDTVATGTADDTVHAGGGVDLLVIDYSGVDDPWGLTLDGSVSAYSYYESIVFDGFERFRATGTQNDGNAMTGGLLDDTLIGGGGEDTLDTKTGAGEYVEGRGGIDRWKADLSGLDSTMAIVFSASASQSTVQLLANGTDVSGIESLNLSTGAGADNISTAGYARNDVISTGAGNDTIATGTADDTVHGGDGEDTLIIDYSGVDDPYGLTLDGVGAASTYYESMVFSGIERFIVTGTQNDGNNLKGGALNDTLIGGIYDDVLNTGTGSGEYVEGRAGNDRWAADLSGVTTNIVLSAATTQAAAINLTNGTMVWGIEGLTLSTGLGADNISTAGYGMTDYINTGNGNDTIATGVNDDTVIGGGGVDVLVIDYSLVDDPYGLTLNGVNAASTYYESIVFSGIERFNVIGTQFDGNDLTGGNLTDTLIGGDANDTLNTLAGSSEVVNGRLGADRWAANLGGVSTAITFSALASQNATVTLTNGTKISNIEALTLTTGSGADNLSTAGYGYNDTINAGGGDDTIATGWADDVVDGGAGVDILVIDYSNIDDPYGLTLDGSAGAGTYYESISFSNIERFRVTGTQNDGNNLTGGALADTLIGGAGGDSLNTLAGSNEVVDGKDGADLWLANLSAVTTNIVFSAQATQGAVKTLTNGTKVSNIEALTITTGKGADNLSTAGYGFNDNIATGLGNDTIATGWGDDVVDGGGGIDTLVIDYSNLDDPYGLTLNGTSGAGTYYESISFTGIERFVVKGTLNDSNNLTGAERDDDLTGGNANDTIVALGGADTVNGGAGNDSLDAGEGDNSVTGGAGADGIWAGAGDDTVKAGEDNDFISTGAGADWVDGGAGVDHWVADKSLTTSVIKLNLNLAGGSEYMQTGLLKGVERLTLSTGSGGDRIITKSDFHNDVVNTNAGNDEVTVAAGRDVVNMGTQSTTAGDVLTVEWGTINYAIVSSVLTSDADGWNGVLYWANNGDDGGFNRVDFTGVERFRVTLGSASDNIQLGDSRDTVEGGDGGDTLKGAGGNDKLDGDLGGDRLEGGAGNDKLFGEDGNDWIEGGDGADLLTGALGSDTFTGGLGIDQFIFLALEDSSGATVDRIKAFELRDKINLKAIDAKATTVDGDQAFVLADAFTHKEGQLIVRQDTVQNLTFVEGDVNGDGVADISIALEGLFTKADLADSFIF